MGWRWIRLDVRGGMELFLRMYRRLVVDLVGRSWVEGSSRCKCTEDGS